MENKAELDGRSEKYSKRKAYLEKRKELYPEKYKISESLYASNAKIDTPQKIVDDAIARQYPRMSDQMRNQFARMVVLYPEGRTITLGHGENAKKVPVNSLSVAVADSIELINSSTSSREEYHDWIITGQEVISDMNTDGVTQDELDARNFFLKDLDQREVELMTCLGLYQRGIDDPKVRAKYDMLYGKLQKLREIRSAVKGSTQPVVTEQEKQNNEKAEKAYPSVDAGHVMIAAIGALSIYDRLTKEEKKELDMYHGDDFRNMDFHSHLSNYYLYNGDIRFNNKNVGEEKSFETSPLEANLLKKHNTQANVAHHIKMLQMGRQTNFEAGKVDKKVLQNDNNENKHQNTISVSRILEARRARGL